MDALVRSEVREVGFGFYTDDELRKLSACKVTSPIAQDSLGNCLTGGLYDARLGPCDQQFPCATCSLSYFGCPGHCGHIDLDVPVYHPMLFSSMFSLLKSKCMYCHKLRMSVAKVRLYLIKLKLLEMGDVANADTLDDFALPITLVDEKHPKEPADLEKRLKFYEERFATFAKRSGGTRRAGFHLKQLQKHVIDGFTKAAMAVKKCENCGAYSPVFRKDGHTKIFQKPFAKKVGKAMAALRFKSKSALEALRGDEENAAILADDSDAEAKEGGDSDEDDDDAKPSSADKYFVPMEVEAQIKLLWSYHADILDFIWGRSIRGGAPTEKPNKESWKLFFSRVVLVPPNRFRPLSKVGEGSAEHPQNVHLSKIIATNENIKRILVESSKDHVDGESRNGGTPAKNGEQKGFSDSGSGEDDENNPSGVVLDSGLSKVVSHWIELQDAVNCFMDSAKNPNPLGGQDVPGIRQLLERKEGLFRKHMMGKRVNYCCRSVISPDPYIGTNEVGIPVLFAKTLHYPTPVNHFNVKYLRKLVENGPHNYPGANQIEYADGKILKLEKLSAQERMAKANLLQKEKGAKVYRHLINGDVLLVNRQPTLHKPGVMAHKARVLTHVKEQTLRLSYANCNSYNADFDGDEMNCHFVQNDLARSEASFICNTDNQYIVPTSGNPLRGLIQDHVVSGVKLTCRNTFLSKAEFQQLLYIAVSGLPGTEVVASTERIVVPRPAILKPRPLWTGKQVVSSLIAHLCRAPLPSLHLDGKTRTPPTAYGAEQEEHVVVFRHGELLCGVIDKASVGNAAMGIVHAVYELYGGELAGRLLNAFGRLFTFYLQDAGHSCGIEDLTLTAKADEQRRALLQKVGNDAEVGLKAFLAGDTVTEAVAASAGPITESQRRKSQFQLAEFMSTDRKEAKIRLDGAMQAVINKSASDVIKVCIPNGLDMPFTRNDFSMMVLTGAKGSAVNQSQISCFLGQQALEGMRVPIMISGKSLPSFRPYDTSARAGGFVQDRFLTGVKPQEYYFHCMAGREGLVDTAVKTSRSGYLQRCLVKHLEELKIAYDMTVRDSGGNIVQFLYGEDGLDPVNTGLLGGKPNQMLFLARNNQGFVYKYSLHGDFFTQSGLNLDEGMNHRLRLSQAKALLAQSRNTKDISRIVKKGNVVLARRKAISSLPWSIENLLHKWEVAEIVKVRDGKSDDGERRVDLRYLDGTVEKKVPFSFQMTPRPSAGGGPENSFVRHLPVQLIKAGLPDPAMSHLRLDTAVGAISEKIQDAIVDYVHKNPDGAITSQTTDTSVSAESFELLMWVKYMRSLASPGEAVGCVAAQSIGEPSTQMTLNTFHLAGHGGANVTLGIPRLREILMTASKTPKTPTMLIPLAASEKMASAKFLARQLSRLSLGTLLKHKCGVEVREKLARGKVFRWERQYRIRFQFESPTAIATAFGVTFEDILDTLRVKFRGKLVRLIRMEQRRAGEKATGRQDAVGQFGSKGGGDEVETRRGRLVGDNGEEREDEDGAADDGEKKGGKGKSWENEESSEDEDDDEEEDVDDEREQGTLRLGGKQEVSGYEDEEDEDNKSEEGGNIMDVLNLGSSEEEESGSGDDDSEDSDDNKSGPGVVISKSAVTPTKARRNNRFDFDQSVAHNEAEGWAEIQVTFPANSRRFLMVQLAEKAASDTLLRSTKNISNAYALQCEISGKDGVGVQTEGVNFEAIWSLPENQILFSELKSNDIWAVLQAYGVEAARSIIVAEILGVFGVYGIDVNPRHLSLIADFMTRTGSYLAMNRMGMNSCPSPFVQMSFETTCNFLTKAAQEGFIESQESPSARIVLGSVSKVGTGCFELMVPLQQTA